MKIYLAFSLAAVFLTACSASSNFPSPGTMPQAQCIYWHQQQHVQLTPALREKEAQRFLVLINRYRRTLSLRPLALDAVLQKSAQWMSEDMAQHDYMAHTDSQGRDPFKRMADMGYTANTYKAENVAAGQATAEEVFAAWKKSPHHNANMLNANFAFLGVGWAYNRATEYGWFWATTFGGEKSREK